MSLVAVLNSQPEVFSLIEKALAPDHRQTFVLSHGQSS